MGCDGRRAGGPRTFQSRRYMARRWYSGSFSPPAPFFSMRLPAGTSAAVSARTAERWLASKEARAPYRS